MPKKTMVQAGWMRLLVCASLLVVAGAPVLSRAQQAGPEWSKTEREAVEVVNAWRKAWMTKDAQKTASYMAENVLYQDDESKPFKTGRASFMQDYNSLYVKIITKYEMLATYAAGGDDGVAVMQKRIDHVNRRDGGTALYPYVGYYKVKDGRIIEWREIRIARPPEGVGPAPTPSAAGAAVTRQ